MSIYIAGSSAESDRIKLIRTDLQNQGFHVYASWLDWSPSSHPNEEANWVTCIHEVRKSEAVLIIAPEVPNTLRGAIFEAGYARGCNKLVYIWNPDGVDLGTWTHSVGVHSIPNFSDLIQLMDWAK